MNMSALNLNELFRRISTRAAISLEYLNKVIGTFQQVIFFELDCFLSKIPALGNWHFRELAQQTVAEITYRIETEAKPRSSNFSVLVHRFGLQVNVLL